MEEVGEGCKGANLDEDSCGESVGVESFDFCGMHGCNFVSHAPSVFRLSVEKVY